MTKYLIALDMDGTLLNSNKEISQSTKEYLKQLVKQGHKVVIASGRPIRAIQRYYDELELNTPIICYNGARIIALNAIDFPQHNFAFPHQIIRQIYNEIKDICLDNIMCETDEKVWLIKDDPTLAKFFWLKDMEVIIGDLNNTLNEDPSTMIIKSTDTKYNNVIIDAVKKYPNLCVRFWGGDYDLYSELYFANVSKGASLKYIADFYNINKENIIAIGDAKNDLEMFEFAGTSIAMINGDEEAKNNADIVSTYDNDHDGIMFELKKIIEN